jgi:hypothetical protein
LKASSAINCPLASAMLDRVITCRYIQTAFMSNSCQSSYMLSLHNLSITWQLSSRLVFTCQEDTTLILILFWLRNSQIEVNQQEVM